MPKRRPEGRCGVMVDFADVAILKDGCARWGWMMVVEEVRGLFCKS